MPRPARRAGVSIPLFSIRAERSGEGSSWGLGEIGDLVPFARWAAQAGFGVVQILPVNEPAGGQDSPYAARSAFALDPVYAVMNDVEDFVAAGGIDAIPGAAEALARVRAATGVDWGTSRWLKRAAMALAWRRFASVEIPRQSPRALELSAYAVSHHAWLEDYALFAALHEDHGDVAWTDWPDPLRRHVPEALAPARERLADAVGERVYTQWQLDRQWRAARAAAEAAGVTLMGDLPFMVAGDSADVWQRANEFRLDARLGVPPDAFSADGQDWGLPVYRWNVMEASDFHWLRERAARAAELYGIYRIDHVVGLFRTYYREHGPKSVGKFTPSEEADQIRLGERLLAVLGSEDGRVIGEDLGVIPDFVRESLTRVAVPGYRVQRWEKDDEVFRDPAEWPACSVATTGTHDTETLAEWFDALTAAERAAFFAIPGLEALAARAPARFDDSVRDAILRLVYASSSDLALIPFQDAFGARERINIPGTVGGGNWTYRMPVALSELDPADTARLAALALGSSRPGASATPKPVKAKAVKPKVGTKMGVDPKT